MSDALCYVRMPDGNVMFAKYQGSSDIMHNGLYATIDEAWIDDHWPKECDCEKEVVAIYCDYGGGFYFPGYVCAEHRFVSPYYINNDYGDVSIVREVEGCPTWAKEFIERSKEKYVNDQLDALTYIPKGD